MSGFLYAVVAAALLGVGIAALAIMAGSDSEEGRPR